MSTSIAPHRQVHCIVCRQPFDFIGGEVAFVLKHVAYGFDFVHDGRCLSAAQELLFPEPGYDCAAFARDPDRRRLLGVGDARGWAVVRPNAVAEPLSMWALVERGDGAQGIEGVIREDTWVDEPGGAEFPESWSGARAPLGYVSMTSPGDSARPTELAELGLLCEARLRVGILATALGTAA